MATDEASSMSASIERVLASINTPEFFGRALVSEVLHTARSRSDKGLGEGEFNLAAKITIKARPGLASDCFAITLCYEDEVAQQSRCIDAFIC